MLPPHVAVIYDSETLTPLRVYVNEDHEDGAHIFTIQPDNNEIIKRIAKSEVRGLSLYEIANKAIN